MRMQQHKNSACHCYCAHSCLYPWSSATVSLLCHIIVIVHTPACVRDPRLQCHSCVISLLLCPLLPVSVILGYSVTLVSYHCYCAHSCLCPWSSATVSLLCHIIVIVPTPACVRDPRLQCHSCVISLLLCTFLPVPVILGYNEPMRTSLIDFVATFCARTYQFSLHCITHIGNSISKTIFMLCFSLALCLFSVNVDFYVIFKM